MVNTINVSLVVFFAFHAAHISMHRAAARWPRWNKPVIRISAMQFLKLCFTRTTIKTIKYNFLHSSDREINVNVNLLLLLVSIFNATVLHQFVIILDCFVLFVDYTDCLPEAFCAQLRFASSISTFIFAGFTKNKTVTSSTNYGLLLLRPQHDNLPRIKAYIHILYGKDL